MSVEAQKQFIDHGCEGILEQDAGMAPPVLHLVDDIQPSTLQRAEKEQKTVSSITGSQLVDFALGKMEYS